MICLMIIANMQDLCSRNSGRIKSNLPQHAIVFETTMFTAHKNIRSSQPVISSCLCHIH
jgi:hypothetical protein